MKVIICGGRNYILTKKDREYLDSLSIEYIVTGNASGADRCAQIYAINRGIPYKVFKAPWVLLGTAAGPKRNEEMARYLSKQNGEKLVICFPGGKGTKNMKYTGLRFGIDFVEFE